MQSGNVSLGTQDRAVCGDVVGYKLSEDWPSSGAVGQGFWRIFNVSAIADTPGAAERVQKLFIGPE
jgi:hypothetical protein